MTTRDLTHLYSLTITRGDDRRRFHFDEYEALLETRARIAVTHPDLTIEEPGEAEFLFETAEQVSNFVDAWAAGDVPPSRRSRGQPVEQGARAARSGTKAEQLIELLRTTKTGVTADEVAKRFGIKKNSATARISVESRKRGLPVERVDGKYRIAA